MGAGAGKENPDADTTTAQEDQSKSSGATKIDLNWHHPTRELSKYYKMLSTRPIGRGHFAEVYLGQALQEHKHDLHNPAQLVAIKAIHRKRTNEETLHREVDTMLKVATNNHPNIVSLYDAFLTPDTLYLVMEYSSGGELFDHLVKKGPYTEQKGAELCKQLAGVIKYMHSMHVVHRDLKPENCLLSDESDDAIVKVADFGLANLKKQAFMTNVCGTWAYCAPEVKRDRAYTKAVDIWSLGVILFILMAGYHPFDSDGDASNDELDDAVAKGDFDFDDPNWHGASDEVKDLIVKMLCVDAPSRITIQGVLNHPWITHKAAESKLVTEPSKLRETIKNKIRKREELGVMLHVMAISRMEHLALKHGLLTSDHVDDAHKLHDKHASAQVEKDPASASVDEDPAAAKAT